MQAHHLLFAVILLVAVALALWVVVILRRMRDPLDNPDGRPDWPIGLLIVVALLGLNAWMDDREARLDAQLHAEAIERARIAEGYLPPAAARLVVDLNRCPPQRPGMTSKVILAVETRPDGRHIVHPCGRIAEQHYPFETRAKREVRG